MVQLMKLLQEVKIDLRATRRLTHRLSTKSGLIAGKSKVTCEAYCQTPPHFYLNQHTYLLIFSAIPSNTICKMLDSCGFET